jgi:hypothetical protein
MTTKDVFIAETASRILAAMCACPDKEPSPEKALELAEQLWAELKAKAYVNTFNRIGTPDDI